jgi:hypothetical protein
VATIQLQMQSPLPLIAKQQMQQQMLLLRQRQHMLQQQLQQRHQIRWRLGRLLDFVVYI